MTSFVQASTQQASTGASLCGNGVIDAGEQCDGINLASQTCQTRGFFSGALNCNGDCTINLTACVAGGGGGGGYVPPVETKVIFSGKAFPGSKVVLLRDAQIVASVSADPRAEFNISFLGLSSAKYIFSLYAEDVRGRRSPLLNYPITVTSGTTISITGVFIAPTIDVDKIEVVKGDNIAIFGQSAPGAEVTISVNSEQEHFVKQKADSQGAYLLNFDTSVLEIGKHNTKSKAAINGGITAFGQTVDFKVGSKNVDADPKKIKKADLNGDGKVNLVDFSILLFWYKKQIYGSFAEKEKTLLSGDGKMDIVDFSIMVYHWTG